MASTTDQRPHIVCGHPCILNGWPPILLFSRPTAQALCPSCPAHVCTRIATMAGVLFSAAARLHSTVVPFSYLLPTPRIWATQASNQHCTRPPLTPPPPPPNIPVPSPIPCIRSQCNGAPTKTWQRENAIPFSGLPGTPLGLLRFMCKRVISMQIYATPDISRDATVVFAVFHSYHHNS